MSKLKIKALTGAMKKAYKYFPRCEVSHDFDIWNKTHARMKVNTTLNGKPYGVLEVTAYVDGHVVMRFTKPESAFTVGRYGIKTFGPCDSQTFHRRHQGGRFFTKTAHDYVHENMISDAEDLRALLWLYSQIILSGTNSL